MIADILYPILTLTITVLNYFNVWGFHTDIFTKALPWGPGGLTATPIPPAAIIFGLVKNRCTHIFPLLSPDLGLKKYKCKCNFHYAAMPMMTSRF